MEGKKKYFVLVLFLFLGLTIFIFANQYDKKISETGNNNDTKEIIKDNKANDEDSIVNTNPEQVGVEIRRNIININNNQIHDNSYNQALAAVEAAEATLSSGKVQSAQELVNLVTNNNQKNELNKRLEAVKNIINITKLVKQLEDMVKEATEKKAIDDARNYREENQIIKTVGDLTNTSIKETLTKRLEEVAKVLDDKESPVILGVENNLLTKDNISITIIDDNVVNLKVTLNGQQIESLSSFEEEGIYTVVATDAAYNEKKVTFTIDKTAPIVTGVENGMIKQSITPVIIDDNIDSISLNDENFISGTKIKIDGEYILVATDKAGNKTTINFEVDRTNPSITGVENNKYYRKDVTPVINEKNIKKIVVTLDGNEINYTQGSSIKEEGVYVFIVRDEAGNRTELTFTIDKTAPIVTGVKNGIYYNKDVTPIITDTNLQNVTVKLNGNKYTKYSVGSTLTEEGTYELRVTDKAGNKFNYITFVIDKTVPETIVTKSNNDKSTNKDVVVTIISNEEVTTPTDWNKIDEYTYTKTYSENGKYEVKITDKAGNEKVTKFEVKRIDKVAPIVTLVDPNKYQLEVHSLYVDKGYQAYDEVDKDLTNRIKITYQFQAKGTSNWLFVETLDTSKLGTYKVIYTVTDKAGNLAKGTRVVQIVDTTAPLITLNGEKNIILTAGVDTYTELGATVTDNYDEKITNLQPELINYSINDKFVSKVDSIDTTKPGVYKIKYTHNDSSGNIGVDISRNDHNYVLRVVTIKDINAPEVKVKNTSVGEDGIYSKIDLEISDDFSLDQAIINNKEYNLTDKNYNLDFADVDNYIEGENVIVIKDKYGNKSTFTFILDKTAPKFENIKSTMETPAKINVIEENLKTITIYNKITKESYNVENGYELTTEGYYTITAIDKAKNKSERWNLTLDNEAPIITIENSKDNNLYNRDVVVNISDIELQQTYLDNVRQGRATTLTIIEEGIHIVKAIDKYGHENQISFIIDKTAPTIEISYNTENPSKSVIVTLITNEEVEIVNSGTWNPNTGYNKSFKKVYTFNTNQKVTVRDKAGNENTRDISITNIDREAPTAIVTISNDIRSDNGRWVTFEFNEAIDNSTIPQGMSKVSGNIYKKVYYKSGSLNVKDLAGNETTITFEF